MYSHTTLGTNDWEKAKPFWHAVMAALGHAVLFEHPAGIAYGEPTGAKIFIGPTFDQKPAQGGNGVHIAFIAKDRKAVDTFHAAALANGGIDEGAPGPRPHYHPNYYGAYVRDPDGNKLQAVCHSKPA
jgi:catechol 2,3-dioxygenase-like lactoylglutathione lyase family enzyme